MSAGERVAEAIEARLARLMPLDPRVVFAYNDAARIARGADVGTCHPACTLGADVDHPGYLGYRCIDANVEPLPFPGEEYPDA